MTNQLDPKQRALWMNQFQVVRIIAFGFLVSIGILWFVASQVLKANPVPGAMASAVVYMIYGAALMALVASVVIKKILLKINPSVQSSTDDDLTLLIKKPLIATLVAMALAEAPALYGFILYVSTGQIKHFYTLAFLAMLMLIYHFPRLVQWEEWLNKALVGK